jgi:alkylhydroperoxidase/carboxymuconolactone decarboxylase family protein YurZ
MTDEQRADRGTALPSADADYLRERFDPTSGADIAMLAEFRPDVVEGYLHLRRAARDSEVPGGLTARERELVILAIECARMKTNPPPVRHARHAIEAGATPMEIADVVSLCIMISGMLSYAESGRYVLKAAIERARELEKASGAGAGTHGS